MVVMARDSWTDERLDDLKSTVDEGFKEMREEFRAQRTEIGALNRSIQQLTYGLIGTMFLGFMGTIAAIVTQP